MWCVLEERATSQSVVTPPSITVKDLKKLELDVKVCNTAYLLYCYLIKHSHTATCKEGDVRLGIGNFIEFYTSIDEYEDYYFIKDELARGRIEVCIGGRYGTVCDNEWDDEDVSVICYQLGFSYFG